MRRCIICLSDFNSDEAFIPALRCSCVIVVHKECWDQWTGACLYCREYAHGTLPIYIEIERPQQSPLDLIRICLLYLVLLAFITWFQLYMRFHITRN